MTLRHALPVARITFATRRNALFPPAGETVGQQSRGIVLRDMTGGVSSDKTHFSPKDS